MFILRASLAVGLTLTLTAALLAAPAGVGHRSSSRHGIEGTVVGVHHDRANGRGGWIKVRRLRHYGHGRRGSTSVAASLGRNRFRRGRQTITFPVNTSTRFEHLRQGGNGAQAAATTFQAVRSGERVRVHPGSGRSRAARAVVILLNANRGASHRRRHHVYHRHSLVNSVVLSRHHRRHHHAVNRALVGGSAVRQSFVRRPVRHTLIRGRVASRNVRHRVASAAVKHVVKNHKPAPLKHTTAKAPAKRTNHKSPAKQKNHKPGKHSAARSHAASHSRSSHHKR
ncbi:MAG TPA: hypothetical protein VH682_32155 [Gemmataceae bacterium]